VNGRNTERSLALAGVVFVVLMLISAFLPGSPPKPDDSAAKIVKFVVDKNDELRWAAFVGLLAGIVLLGWLGAVWRTMRRAEGGTPMLAVGAALGGGLAAALFTIGGVVMSAVAIVGPDKLGPQTTRFFYVLFNALGSGGAIALALFVGAFASVILETGVLPKVMGWLGVLVAIALLVAGGGVASTRDVFFVFGFIGFAGAAIWVFVISILMFRADARPGAVASAS
jgi:hypothetical protein